MQILIVEDDLVTRLLIERNLKKWGYTVVAVDNISTAIEIILANKIQFVLTDWIMPGGNGTILCECIRACNLSFYTYIILVTFLDDTQSIVQGMNSGADDFIRKPIQLDELHARICAGERVLELEKKLQESNDHLTELSNKLLAANEVINRDLRMAATMQRSLLPNVAAFSQGIAIDWLFHPSTDLSGDIFNFFPLDDHHVGFYMIDVAGHGIASAMQSFTLSRLLSPDRSANHLIFSLPEAPYCRLIQSASSVVSNLNQQFQTDSVNTLYFTMIYGVIDTLSHTIELCQAGHPHPIYLQKEQSAEFIVNSGLPIGIITQADYESVHLSYGLGDRLFLYSDGITECESPAGEMFGEERLRAFINETRHLKIGDVMHQLDEQIRSWRGGNNFDDDISMLVLEICCL
jgi:sigma-B regulation protein RsbU (phosphoserine phosphatase)